MGAAKQLALWRGLRQPGARRDDNGMTMADRIAAFKARFPDTPAAWPWPVQEKGRDALYAVWVMGNDYRTRSTYYGAYPHGYLPRVMALFPDVIGWMRGGEVPLLHVFSGSLPARDQYARCDLRQPAEFPCSVYDLPHVTAARFPLILADPPYSREDAKKYGTPSVNQRRALEALAEVAEPGGHLVWLDTTWPMHSKRQWATVGRILIRRSTMHRTREVTIFERQ